MDSHSARSPAGPASLWGRSRAGPRPPSRDSTGAWSTPQGRSLDMTEDRFEELLGLYLLGELSVEEERELERHLEECSGCRGELARARQTHDLLRELVAGGAPPGVKERGAARAGGGDP